MSSRARGLPPASALLAAAANDPEFWNARYRAGPVAWDHHGVPRRFAEFLARVRDNPKGATFASPGQGSSPHLATETFILPEQISGTLADGTSMIPAVSQGIPVRYLATIYGVLPNVVIARTGADEMILTAQIFDHGARLKSFALVAEAWGLADTTA